MRKLLLLTLVTFSLAQAEDGELLPGRDPAATKAGQEVLENAKTEDAPLTTWPRSGKEYRDYQDQANSAPPPPSRGGHRPLGRDEEEDIGETVNSFYRPAYGRLHLGAGYMFSNWSKISPKLKDGSLAIQIGISRGYGRHVESGLGFLFLTGSDNSQSSENTYAGQVNLDTKYLFLDGRLRPFAGLGLGFGSFRAWNLASETDTQITYDKNASGYLFGATPMVGMRIHVMPFVAIDLNVIYSWFFTQPSQKIGGLGILTSLSLTRK